MNKIKLIFNQQKGFLKLIVFIILGLFFILLVCFYLVFEKWQLKGNLDNDSLTIEEEKSLGTDPKRIDTDGDGLNDGEEVKIYHTDPKRIDTDGDGLNDGEEIVSGHSPLEVPSEELDIDKDNLIDYFEIYIYKTSPENPDTDGDGISDKEEIEKEQNPLEKEEKIFSFSLENLSFNEFVNPLYKYKIKYPKDWQSDILYGQPETVSFKYLDHIVVSIEVLKNPKKLTLSEWLKSRSEESKNLKEILINKLKGLKSFQKNKVYFSKGDRIFILNYFPLEGKDYQVIFDQMINSFKFLI